MCKAFKISVHFLVTISIFWTAGCKFEVTKSSNKEITGYWFTSGNNSSLSSTVTCSISGTAISCSVPYGTVVTGLVATFNSTGDSIKVGNTVQISGSTANDFANAVTYTVTAEDETTQNYTVTVTVAAASDKSITSFVFKAANNSVLSSDITGTVYQNSHTIGASVPAGTSVTALCPTVTIAGSSVNPASDAVKDFSNPVTYTVTAADGSTQDYTAAVSVSSDTTAPTNPSISINGGAASTTSTSVTLSLSASDNIGVTAYYASESSATPTVGDSGWVSVTSAASYSGSVSFTLSSGSATKTVYVWFKDGSGNISSSASDSIVFNDLANGLIAYYPFNGNANDESGNGYNGTVNGATLTTDHNSSANKAYSFDGNDYIDIPNLGVFNGSTSFSVCGWAQQSDDNTERTYIHFFGENKVFCRYAGNPSWNNKANCIVYFSTTPYAVGGSIQNNTWFHWALVYNNSNGLSFYVNGVLEDTNAQTGTIDSVSIPNQIGRSYVGLYYHTGQLDDFRIYNRALSLSEIQALYNE